jgi:hypothetical protein
MQPLFLRGMPRICRQYLINGATPGANTEFAVKDFTVAEELFADL